MPTLRILTGGPNPTTIDLSNYLILTDDGGADPYDPVYTQRVFAKSLLRKAQPSPCSS